MVILKFLKFSGLVCDNIIDGQPAIVISTMCTSFSPYNSTLYLFTTHKPYQR